MANILAIDGGTTGVRAIVFDETGVALGSDYAEVETRYPKPGWAEQDAARYWDLTSRVVRGALKEAAIEAGDLVTVGLCNQRSSIVAWDSRTLEPLSPLITWQDVRAKDRAEELLGQGYFVSANMAVSKADWIVHNIDVVAEASKRGTLRIGGVESWLAAKLTGGAHISDHANASSTGFYAHLNAAWEERLLEAVDVDPQAMPELTASLGVFAKTDREVFGANVPIGAMCGDQQASLFGLGCDDGAIKCSYGTSAMVDLNTGENVTLGGSGTYPLVAWTVDDTFTWCLEGNVVTAGAAVQWLRDGVQFVGDAKQSAVLAESVDDDGGVWVVPGFQGIGTPVAEPRARAMIGGLSRGSTHAHIVRATLVGIASRVADVVAAVQQSDTPIVKLRVDGGASRNDFLMQEQADLLGAPVERSAQADGASLGVAMMAAAAVGLREKRPDMAGCRIDRVFEPTISSDERQARRDRWKKRLELATSALAE